MAHNDDRQARADAGTPHQRLRLPFRVFPNALGKFFPR